MKFKMVLTGMLACVSLLTFAEESLFDSALDNDGGLFEDSLDNEESVDNSFNSIYRLNGLLKSGIYLNRDMDETNDSYFVSSLKLETDLEKGKAYADMRFEDRKNEDETYLREAYIDYYGTKLDLRLGKQIVVWGRADAMNPTDNINPKDRVIYSPNVDDSRIANFMVKANYDLYPFNLEAVIVPDYIPSETPIAMSYVDYDNKSSLALKLSYEYPKIDGSFSYYTGYSTNPGVTFSGGSTYLKPYEQSVYGFDFATNIGKYGFRNEFAYKQTEDYEENAYIPNPELAYIVGIDRDMFENFNLNLQYYLKYISDFEENKTSVEEFTAIINQQTEEVQNTLIYRATYNMFYETFQLENLASYNLDTEEFYTKLEGEYDIADSFAFIVGTDYYDGEEGTLTGKIKDIKTSYYTELKIEF